MKALPKLFSLSIKKNEIEHIAEDFFDSLLGLETLLLDNNKIRRLPSSIENLKRLKQLSHENNPIENKPEWISMIKNLIENTLKMGNYFSI